MINRQERHQPTTTTSTADTAKRQLKTSDDNTRTEGTRDDDNGEIMGVAFVVRSKVIQTRETIERNKAMGRAQSRTSACVRAQHAAFGRAPSPTAYEWFMS